MAKRPTVEVDEEYLKEVMAGGASVPKKEKQAAQPPASPPQTESPVKEEEKEAVMPPDAGGETKEPAKTVRKKKETQDYEPLFLQRKAGVPRRQTYISAALYEKINSFLPVIANGLSITAYLDNILTHHLDLYREDINELYEKKSQKPF
ncbi:transposase [Bacteroidia bacterium]|nr:transposase [Bacteroidia bacterium]